MSWSGSGLYAGTLLDVLDTTQLAIDLDLETHKIALYDNTITPDFAATAPAYATSGEIVGTGYTAGGNTTGTAPSQSGGIVTWDADDPQWDNSTLSGVRGAIIYADGLAGDNPIEGVDLGQAYNTSAGTLLLTVNVAGLAQIDCVQ